MYNDLSTYCLCESFYATSGEKQCEGSRLRHGHSKPLNQTLALHFESKWTGGGRWRLWAVGWEVVVVVVGGVLGYNYVKNYLYSCFMICSGGVCFKVLPRDWQCVTKMQTHGVLKRRNWLICVCASVCVWAHRYVYLLARIRAFD